LRRISKITETTKQKYRKSKKVDKDGAGYSKKKNAVEKSKETGNIRSMKEARGQKGSGRHNQKAKKAEKANQVLSRKKNPRPQGGTAD